jgi:hypothetical protein
MPSEIKVSASTFHEIAQALEVQGKKLGTNVGALTLEKDDKIIDPVNWKFATIRRDCLVEAVKAYGSSGGTIEILKIANLMFEFVINGGKNQDAKQEWK